MDHQGGQAGGGAQTASPASLAPQWSAKLDAHILPTVPGPQGLSAALSLMSGHTFLHLLTLHSIDSSAKTSFLLF